MFRANTVALFSFFLGGVFAMSRVGSVRFFGLNALVGLLSIGWQSLDSTRF